MIQILRTMEIKNLAYLVNTYNSAKLVFLLLPTKGISKEKSLSFFPASLSFLTYSLTIVVMDLSFLNKKSLEISDFFFFFFVFVLDGCK